MPQIAAEITQRLLEAFVATGYRPAERGGAARVAEGCGRSREAARKWISGEAIPELLLIAEISRKARLAAPHITTLYILDGIVEEATHQPSLSVEATQLIALVAACDRAGRVRKAEWPRIQQLINAMALPPEELSFEVYLTMGVRAPHEYEKRKPAVQVHLTLTKRDGTPVRALYEGDSYEFYAVGQDAKDGHDVYQLQCRAQGLDRRIWIDLKNNTLSLD